MKNKKGFTLIELLAVIVILAIISTIAIGTLIGVIEKAKLNSLRNSAYGLVDAVDLYYAQYLTSARFDIKNNKVTTDAEHTLNYKGSVKDGVVAINDEGKSVVCVNDGKNTAYKNLTEEEVTALKNNTCYIEEGTYEVKLTNEVMPPDEEEEEPRVPTELEKENVDPVEYVGLIPVKISNTGVVTKTDKDDTTWYDYDNKKWANAVILVDKTKTYNNGDIIPNENIQSYFVWIPKFRYKLWNVNRNVSGSQMIDIKIGDYDTKDSVDGECTTPMTSGNIGNCKNGDYMTHPAFLSLGVKGFWVGKYETGYLGATTSDQAKSDTNDSSKVIIKPNVFDWRLIKVSNIIDVCQNYLPTLNSHMMKNTEWGAVAYLSHSKYGTGKQISINNNSDYKTGYATLSSLNQTVFPGDSGNTDAKTVLYNTTDGVLASTTGNITGIYDMSGGANEYMASYMSGQKGSSGLATLPTGKYYDVYSASSSIHEYQYMILGDATGELGPFSEYRDSDNEIRAHNSWYNNNSHFVGDSGPWFARGGKMNDGFLAGQFQFFRGSGVGSGTFTFRIVLSPDEA